MLPVEKRFSAIVQRSTFIRWHRTWLSTPLAMEVSCCGPATTAEESEGVDRWIKHQCPTVLINRNAATVYAEAVRAIKQRGYTQITNPDDARYFVEVTRNGKSATLQVDLVGSDQSRIIITIENDKQARDTNEVAAKLIYPDNS